MNFSCRLLVSQFKTLNLSVTGTSAQIRNKIKRPLEPQKRYPKWFVDKDRVKYDEELTNENISFLKEMVHDKFGPPASLSGVPSYDLTPLKREPLARGSWFPNCRRSGLITRKIGVLPQWDVNGRLRYMTLLQVIDNHVVKYIPPSEYVPARKPVKRFRKEGKLGCLVVGAISCDPQLFTKEYCGLFTSAGLMPKQVLTRFPIHPEAAITPGTRLTAAHFRVGDIVDTQGFTKYRGFQGVMKRWGFHGMPATHGVTKTHRRPGNIGSGGEKARVWPGTKMPGHMGNRCRRLRGLRIWRINYKYNVLYVSGQNVPGACNSIVQVFDTVLPLKKLKESPPFPTYYPEDSEEPLPEEVYVDNLFNFNDPTITFEPEK